MSVPGSPNNPRLIKKVAAAAVAFIACVASFRLLSPEQATAMTSLIAATAAIWEPAKP